MVQIFLDIGEIEQAQSLFDRLPEVAQKLDIGISIASQLNFKRKRCRYSFACSGFVPSNILQTIPIISLAAPSLNSASFS
jgi:hypothetical protein